MKRYLFVLVLCISAGAGFSADFGIQATVNPDLKLDYSRHTFTEGIASNINLCSWVSAPLGNNADFYISAKVTLKCKSLIWQWPLRFEMERTALTLRPAPGVTIEAGRMEANEPSLMIATGLFDGFRTSFDGEKLGLRFSALYSGLMFKETAEILMTPYDERMYARKLNYQNTDTYFASRRVLFSADAELKNRDHDFILGLSALAQFDANKNADVSDALHTQYLSILPRWELSNGLDIHAAATTGLAEAGGQTPRLFFAASTGTDWNVPSSWEDTLSLELHWAGGAHGKNIVPFEPVNVKAPGFAFDPRFSGVTTLSAAYGLQPHRTLNALVKAAYFFRTDTTNVAFADLEPQFDLCSNSPLLGGEIYGFITWDPIPYLRFWTESGLFFPGLGKAFVANAENRWRIKVGLSLGIDTKRLPRTPAKRRRTPVSLLH